MKSSTSRVSKLAYLTLTSEMINSKFKVGPIESKDSKIFAYFRICDDLYNSGRFNFQVLEWAIKEIVDEEHEERKRKEAEEKKRKEEEDALNGIVP